MWIHTNQMTSDYKSYLSLQSLHSRVCITRFLICLDSHTRVDMFSLPCLSSLLRVSHSAGLFKSSIMMGNAWCGPMITTVARGTLHHLANSMEMTVQVSNAFRSDIMTEYKLTRLRVQRSHQWYSSRLLRAERRRMWYGKRRAGSLDSSERDWSCHFFQPRWRRVNMHTEWWL